MDESMEKISYSIHRSYRKTIAITITPEGEVLVKAPKRLSKAFIEGFVSSKADWSPMRWKSERSWKNRKRAFAWNPSAF